MSLLNPTLESLQEERIEPWVGFDLDSTLVVDVPGSKPFDILHIGEPIAPMVERIKSYLAKGIKVKIFTARMAHKDKLLVDAFVEILNIFTYRLFGQILEVTCIKDMACTHFYDDKARQVIPNAGIVVGE